MAKEALDARKGKMQSSPNPLSQGVTISVGKAEGFHWLRNEAFS